MIATNGWSSGKRNEFLDYNADSKLCEVQLPAKIIDHIGFTGSNLDP
jgi:hypothetical protein